MNRRLKLYDVSAFSIFSVLMLAAFILMHAHGTETPCFSAGVYVIIGAAATVVSGVLTLICVMGGCMYDAYQISRVDRVSSVTGTASKVLLPLIAIAGTALDSVGFIVCAGMLAEWTLLLINASAAALIVHRK